MLHAHEVVVPHPVVGHHEEAQKDVGEQHLHLLRMRGEVTRRVHLRDVLVRFTPRETGGREPVRRQRAGSGRETAGGDNGLVGDPGLVVGQNVRMERHVGGQQLRLLIRLRVDPAEGLQIAEVLMLR